MDEMLLFHPLVLLSNENFKPPLAFRKQRERAKEGALFTAWECCEPVVLCLSLAEHPGQLVSDEHTLTPVEQRPKAFFDQCWEPDPDACESVKERRLIGV